MNFFSYLQRYPIVTACLFAACILLIGWFFLIRSTNEELLTLRATERSRAEERIRVAEERATFDRMRTVVESVPKDELQKMDRIVPRGRDVPRLIVALEALASETGVLLKDMSVAESGREIVKDLPSGVKPINLTVTVTGGDYPTLKRFLDALERNARLLDVQSFSFAKGLQAYTLDLRAYYTEL